MQWLVNGITEGLLSGLLALAFMLVYSSTGVFYLALAGVYSLAPFVAVAVYGAGGGWFAAWGAGVLASCLLSSFMEVANHWPLERKRARWTAHFISSMGLNLVIVQVLSVLWGNELQVLGDSSTGVALSVWGLQLSRSQLPIVMIVPLVFASFAVFLRLTRVGVGLRALACDPEALALAGTNVRAMRLTVFALGGALAGLASLLSSQDIGFDAVSGLPAVILSFVALVVGGKNSYWGGPVGGLMLGTLRSAVVWLWSARWQSAATFLVLALFLLLRPQGVLGKQVRLEAP